MLAVAVLAASALVQAQTSEQASVAAQAETVPAGGLCARVPAPFAGTAGSYLPGSQESWPEDVRPGKEAPNILIWLIDDAGFGLTSTFGGLVETQTLDSLAEHGLAYTNFHSTPLCSPSRAALLTGRNPHSVHMGSHSGTAMGFPGYDGYVPPSAATTAKVLSNSGYGTIALGKWDHTPFKQLTPAGPFNLWPLGQGFDHFYGFMWHDTDHFEPTLIRDNSIITEPNPGEEYYFTTDMADQAIAYINSLHSVDPQRPFYMYWATGAVHSPHQASEKWRNYYRGRFDMGWDAYRQAVLQRQKTLGIVPEQTELAAMQVDLPAWETLDENAKQLYARQMEIIAAQMSEADNEFGRIIEALRQNGELDNTLIIVTSDNGASAEGGIEGAFMESARSYGQSPTMAENQAYYEQWGGPETMPHYSAAWAVAANTPYRYFKQTAHDGGHHVPLVISWPKGIQAPGIRNQYSYIADLSPTILQAAGVAAPVCVDGVPQQPIDGIALNYSFNEPNAAERRTTQYYELWGNRGIYHDGWKAVVLHKARAWDIQAGVPFEQDSWQLFNVRNDPGETTDLAAQQPEKLAELQALYDEEAKRYNVYPLADLGARNKARSGQFYRMGDSRDVYHYRQPGISAMSELAGPALIMRSYTLSAEFTASKGDQGVLVAAGGVESGYSLYLKNGKIHYDYSEFGKQLLTLSDSKKLPAGPAKVELQWTQKSRTGGEMKLVVNGREVALGETDIHVFGTHGSNELFNIGLDSGAPASLAYKAPFKFTGTIDDVVISLGPRLQRH